MDYRNSTNPAALQGWVKSTDPKTGRVFYANHITRKTQWEPPAGWEEDPPETLMPPSMPAAADDDDDDEPLPSNWEVMHDPTTGKPFYVDHERKITQWTRPKAPKKQQPVISYAPAKTSTATTSAAMARILQASSPALSNNNNNGSNNNNNNNSNSGSSYYQNNNSRSYHQEASYYHHSHSSTHDDVDFSDTMPTLDFSVKKVADKFRLECPNCDVLFTLSKRRHHCRLCGDIFCDACSSHRVTLPLEGTEFDKPVRVCDLCNKDVEQGNFFSMRRYLTPLQLFDGQDNEEEGSVATPSNVNAALASLTSDLDQMVHNSGSFEERVTIPADVLVPCIMKHFSTRSTSNRAVRALASLLSVGSIVGNNEFAFAVYLYGQRDRIDDIQAVLERSGSDRKTLFVHEQAARIMFYLTDPQVLSSVSRKHNEIQSRNKDEDYGDVDSLDIHRALRNMLDHSSMSKNPNLQRWSAATVRNLVLEDQRRACMAVNEVAARVASGESGGSLGYQSFLDQLVSTGGIMILCSLIGADDSDTRAHATGALGAILTATRAIDESMTALSEMSGGSLGRASKKDGDIVRAITAGGGCGSSVSQLLLSADNSVARMGCEFISSLVLPLLKDPMGCATLPREYDCRNDNEGLGACREAALEFASGSCLPAMLSLARENGRITRPIELRATAMETLAATVNAVGEMGKSWADGKYEEGLERSGAPETLKRAITYLNEEQVIDSALEVLKSSSMQSLGSSRDTPAARIREAAGIMLGALTSCSAEAIIELQSRPILTTLIASSNDATMTAPSSMRGDAAPRCIGMLSAASAVLMFAWQHPSGASSELLDKLIEALDAAVIPYLFKVLTMKMDWDSTVKSAGGMKARSAACGLLCCLFGIALNDETAIGMRRLMDACDANQSDRRNRGPRNIMEAVLTVLQNSLNHAHKTLIGGANRGEHYQAALLDLVEMSILATGSMCGSSAAPGGVDGMMITGDTFLAMRSDEFASRRREVCKVACDVIIRGGRSGPALLPTMLVGGFGEGTVLASLRLSLAIAQNGSKEQHSKLAHSGVLVPVSDLLKTALSGGDLYKFSAALALVRFCGPYVAADTSGGVQSVREAIRIATNVLTLPVNPSASAKQIETQEALKSECISALESLSENASLWSSISSDALPSIVQYLHSTCNSGSVARPEALCAALRAVLKIVQVPSHAVAAAKVGLADELATILKSMNSTTGRQQEGSEAIPELALEILYLLTSVPDARRHVRLLDGDILRSICAALGNSTAAMSDGGNANLTFQGLEILHYALTDVEAVGPAHSVLQSPGAMAFLDHIASEPRFVRSLCATTLLQTGMKLGRPGDDDDNNLSQDVPPTYGPPLVLVQQKCGGYKNTHEAALAIFFSVAVYACAIESPRSEAFWNSALLDDTSKMKDTTECHRCASTFCVFLFYLLDDDNGILVPKDNRKRQEYETISRPLLRYRLLESLNSFLKELTSESVLGYVEMDEYLLALVVHFNLPCLCLSVWKDAALLDLSFNLLKGLMDTNEDDEILPLVVETKHSIVTLFDLLNLVPSSGTTVQVDDIRRFLASTLDKLAKNGLLTKAVEKFEVRSSAIAALAAACLSDEQRNPDEEEDMTSNRMASGLMQCLVDLCSENDTAPHSEEKSSKSRKIVLTSDEAEAIAGSLGQKICHMVISRFLERAKLMQYEIEDEEDIMNAPDVMMLCAIAQHDAALQILRSIGGLHALSQVAAEGEPSAVFALQAGCKEDPSLLLEADTHVSLMALITSKDRSDSHQKDPAIRSQLEVAAFELLSRLCEGSQDGLKAVVTSSECDACVAHALCLVSSLIPGGDGDEENDNENSNDNKQETNPSDDAAKEDGDTDDDDVDDDDDDGGGDEKVLDPSQDDNDADKQEKAQESNATPSDANKNDKANTLSQDDKEVNITDIKDISLVSAAFSFLASLITVPRMRNDLLDHDKFVRVSAALISADAFPDLRFEAVNILAKLAPYAANGSKLSFGDIGSLLQSCLSTDQVDNAELRGKKSINLLYISAVTGLQFIFDRLSVEQQVATVDAVLFRYGKLLKRRCIPPRSSSNKADELANGGQLAYALTSLLLLAFGRDAVAKCFPQSSLVTFVNTVQWRYDPKTVISEDEITHWDASVTHCLQLLSFMVWRSDESLTPLGIKIQDLSATVLMVARPGKTPRKAIDVVSALSLVAKSGDAAAKIAAERIIDRITG